MRVPHFRGFSGQPRNQDLSKVWKDRPCGRDLSIFRFTPCNVFCRAHFLRIEKLRHLDMFGVPHKNALKHFLLQYMCCWRALFNACARTQAQQNILLSKHQHSKLSLKTTVSWIHFLNLFGSRKITTLERSRMYITLCWHRPRNFVHLKTL